MKRDLDLCRDILLKVEGAPPGGLPDCGSYRLNDEVQNERAIDFGDHSEAEVLYNIRLLFEAGFLGQDTSIFVHGGIACRSMTWAGHDYLDAVRDPEIWSKTKSGAAKVGGATFEMVKAIAIGYAKHKASELGIPL